jgi:hypothetical protein
MSFSRIFIQLIFNEVQLFFAIGAILREMNSNVKIASDFIVENRGLPA